MCAPTLQRPPPAAPSNFAQAQLRVDDRRPPFGQRTGLVERTVVTDHDLERLGIQSGCRAAATPVRR
jgi:hypothetical protein